MGTWTTRERGRIRPFIGTRTRPPKSRTGMAGFNPPIRARKCVAGYTILQGGQGFKAGQDLRGGPRLCKGSKPFKAGQDPSRRVKTRPTAGVIGFRGVILDLFRPEVHRAQVARCPAVLLVGEVR